MKLFSLLLLFVQISCVKTVTKKTIFETSFETIDDFNGFYLTPQNDKGTSFHELSDSIVHSGNFSHKAWINGANEPSTTFTNNNHRGYPTIQLYKTEGSYESPCYITFWVWLDIDLETTNTSEEDNWFSFATLSSDATDKWKRTVLVNLSKEGIIHLQHVPKQGKQEHIFQTNSIYFPQKEWVELKIFIDFSKNGYAKVWQNGELVSHANVKNVKNRLSQAHFGMYCPPQLTTGVVYNDDLIIEMVDGE